MIQEKLQLSRINTGQEGILGLLIQQNLIVDKTVTSSREKKINKPVNLELTPINEPVYDVRNKFCFSQHK